jgi:flagellar biosynthesis chaperone FliJ
MITHQEPFKQDPEGIISKERHLTRSSFASPLHEGTSLSPEENLQEQLRRLQECVRELLLKNQELRTLLDSANESP